MLQNGFFRMPMFVDDVQLLLREPLETPMLLYGLQVVHLESVGAELAIEILIQSLTLLKFTVFVHVFIV